jgi:DNA-binding transcriptional ArsR family regulator
MVLRQHRKSPEEFDTFKLVNQTLTPHAREILELLAAGNPPSRVAEAVGRHRSTITYWIKKFKKLGYIKLQTRDVYKIFRLTYHGLKILTGSERGGRVVVLEDYPVKYALVEGEKRAVSWEKLGEPRNWTKLGFKIGNIRVVKTSRSVIVHPGQLKGWDPYRLVYLAGRECSRVSSWLQSHLGMVLGPGEPIKRPTFQVYDPVAEEVTKYYSFKSDVGGADRSPPCRRGHWEMGPEVARDYLLSFSRLHEIQNRLDRIDKHLRGVDYTLNRLTNQIEILVGELHTLTGFLKGCTSQPVKRPELSRKDRFVV